MSTKNKDREKEIARSIREIREKKGISQRELARRAGMDHAILNRIENGTGNLQASTMIRLADALEVNLVELFGYYSEEFGQVWEKLAALSPERRDRMMALLDDLVRAEKSEE